MSTLICFFAVMDMRKRPFFWPGGGSTHCFSYTCEFIRMYDYVTEQILSDILGLLINLEVEFVPFW